MKNVAQEVQAKIIELGQAGKKPGLIAVMTKVKKDDIIAILKEAGIEVEGTPVQDTKAPDAAVVGADAAAPVVEGDAANAAPVEGVETQNKLAQMMNQVQEEKAERLCIKGRRRIFHRLPDLSYGAIWRRRFTCPRVRRAASPIC